MDALVSDADIFLHRLSSIIAYFLHNRKKYCEAMRWMLELILFELYASALRSLKKVDITF